MQQFGGNHSRHAVGAGVSNNAGDWDGTSHYYYDGQKSIETRNGSDQVIKQQVWGAKVHR